MHDQIWTSASIKSHEMALAQRIRVVIPFKDSILKEAHARGLGFGSHAALKAALRNTPTLSARAFDTARFAQRVGELADDATADVVIEVLDDIQIEISVVRRSQQRQQAHRFTDVAYDVDLNVALGGSRRLETSLEGDVLFHLPEFGRGASAEPYRIDSAHDRRAETDYRKTRAGAGEQTLVAKLVDGHWHGGFYVYAPEHQADDTNCLKSLEASLARAILPQLPTRVRCFIFRPDNYDLGAWRVEMRLPPAVQRFWNGATFQFDLPVLPKRRLHTQLEYCVGHNTGRFVDGLWMADLYTNGIAEAENPTSLAEVKRALIDSVNQMILRSGYAEEGHIAAVYDPDGKVVGTVQFRNGWYEAWGRLRTVAKPGNSHRFLGRFASAGESISAIHGGV